MVPQTTLRPALPADATAVAVVLIEARRSFMPYAPSAHPEDDVRRWVREELLPTGGVTVAVESGQVVGVMALRQGRSGSWIDQMMLAPGHVGQGLGSRLLVQALTALPPPVQLYTFQANAGARRFYERHGFVAMAFTDGADNDEHCPDVLYRWTPARPR
jgi:GNAT superfamily N-acetyltransferase